MDAQDLNPLLAAFIGRCRSLLGNLGADGSRLRVLLSVPQRVRWLAEQAESTPEWKALVDALPAPRDSDVAWYVDADRVESRCWFLRNIGLYHDLVEGRDPTLENIVQRWQSQEWGSRRLYLLQGLDLEGEPVIISGVCIRRMAEAELQEYFNNRVRRAFETETKLNGLVDKTYLDVRTGTADLQHFFWAPDVTHPWVAFLNLASTFNITVSAGYDRPIAEIWAPSQMEQDVSDAHVVGLRFDAPRAATLRSDNVRKALDEFEAGRGAATNRRVDVGLKYFARACRSMADLCSESADLTGSDNPNDPCDPSDAEEYAPDRDALERAVVDLTTALEAIYLDSDPRQKAARLTSRCAALLSENDEALPQLQERLRLAYNVRSRLVHGDVCPAYRSLASHCAFLRRTVRRSLVALLRMKGEQQRIIDGIGDAGTRAQNGELVPS